MRKAIVLATILLAGCVAARPADDTQVREAVSGYRSCLDREAAPYRFAEKENDTIAEAVVSRCEPYLSAYRVAVVDFLRDSTHDGTRAQYELLMIEPDRRVENLREQGKRIVLSTLLD
ncbi:MAG: hypothetical protein RQ754_03040 [Desulfuromonadales bacterium]|nr:hypothetical protein [Desulfuromonadales bacterium]